MSTRLLPCRHVFYVRKQLGTETIIPTQVLNARWLLSSLHIGYNSVAPPVKPFSIAAVLPKPTIAWDVNRKYREANHIANVISESVSCLGMQEYHTAIKSLNHVASLFIEKRFDCIQDLAASEMDDQQHRVTEDQEQEQTNSDRSEARSVGPSGSSGTHSGSPVTQSGTSGTSGTHSGTPATQRSRSQITENVVETAESTYTSLAVADLNTTDANFEIANPIRPRGRPKQTSKAKKVTKSRTIEMARTDSDLHDKNLSLSSIPDLLSDAATYDAVADIIKQFKTFVFEKKAKPPIAKLTMKLPPSVAPLETSEITRILPCEIIRRSELKVCALQKKNKGVAERDIAVEFPGFGILTTGILRTMKLWHRAVKALKTIERTHKWIETINFDVEIPSYYRVEKDLELPGKIMKDIPLLSEKMEALDFALKTQLSDSAMMKATQICFSASISVVVINPGVWGAVVDGKTDLTTQELKEMFAGTENKSILLPINCNGNHWCGIMVEMEKHRILYYDSMKSSYVMSIRSIAQRLALCLPPTSGRYHVEMYASDMGIQTDSYNCGVYVLLTFEEFIGGDRLGLVDTRMLQYLRYRYLHMIF